MTRAALVVDMNPKARDMTKIVRGLRAFNERRVARPLNRREFAVYVRGRDGSPRGGIVGVLYWDWLYVDWLWLDERVRGEGWGRKLIARAERIAVRAGCRGVWLDTFSFQAPGFYRRMGYREFGRMKDHPTGHARHFFWKPLVRRQSNRTPARRR
jgi:GNAT superfamily N-acetyltransferase